MPSSLSAHLLDQFYAFRQLRAPFGQPLSPSQLAMSGPMSYAPNMHGAFSVQQPFLDQSMASASGSVDVSSFYTDMAESTAQKIATLQAKLNKKLGPEYISQRPGPGGGVKLTYAEGWKVINLANEVFGFNGWSSSIVNLNTDYIDYSEETKRYNVGASAVIRVTLRDGVYHEDVGYGVLENAKSKGAALDKCKKEAVTDGVKRALRNFGNLLGNCLYDKQYTQEIVKIKVPPPKFDKNALHRRPEFEGADSATSNGTNAPTSNVAAPSNPNTMSKPPVPLIIPKAIGVNLFSNAFGSNASSGHASKPMKAMSAPVLPVATSTPMRNIVPQIAPGEPKDGNVGVIGRPQSTSNDHSAFLSKPRDTRAASVNSSHQVHQASGALFQMPARPVPQEQKMTEPQAPRQLERTDTDCFDSDDDADFLAALEQVEGDAIFNELAADIGRPIDESEGIGSAIDFDEGTHGPEEADSADEKTLVDGRPSLGKQALRNGPRQNHPAAQSGDARASSVSKAQPNQTRDTFQPRESAAAVARVPSASPTISVEEEIANQIVALRQQRNALRKLAVHAPASGFAKPAQGEDAALKSVQNVQLPGNKPHPPSVGGFNFPPGMKHGAPLSSVARQNQTVNVTAGVKRSAEAIKCESQEMGQLNMGVSYSNAQAAAEAQSARQPFSRLDGPDGGELKRFRR